MGQFHRTSSLLVVQTIDCCSGHMDRDSASPAERSLPRSWGSIVQWILWQARGYKPLKAISQRFYLLRQSCLSFRNGLSTPKMADRSPLQLGCRLLPVVFFASYIIFQDRHPVVCTFSWNVYPQRPSADAFFLLGIPWIQRNVAGVGSRSSCFCDHNGCTPSTHSRGW